MSQSKSRIFVLKFFKTKNFPGNFSDFFWPAHAFCLRAVCILRMRAWIFVLRHCEATGVWLWMHGISNTIWCVCNYFVLPKLFVLPQKSAYFCTKNMLFAGLLKDCFAVTVLLQKNMAIEVTAYMHEMWNNIWWARPQKWFPKLCLCAKNAH